MAMFNGSDVRTEIRIIDGREMVVEIDPTDDCVAAESNAMFRKGQITPQRGASRVFSTANMREKEIVAERRRDITRQFANL